MRLIFKAKTTIEFIGDSITDCDRNNPQFAHLGNGYVRNIHNLLQSGYPELRLKIINKGTSGDRVTNLINRWETDVLAINPDWLMIFIGINDVWRFFEGDPQEGVDLGMFTDSYHQLLDSTQSNTESQMRLIAPFLAEKDLSDPFRTRLTEYQAAVDQLGLDFNLPVIHLQPAFDWAMLSKPFSYWTSDRVHPTEEGYMLIALTILRACGFSV